MRRFLNNRISNYNNVGDKVDDFCEDCENRWLPFSRVWWDSTEKNIANIKRKDNGIFVIKKILSLINSISESIKDIYDRINVIEPPILSEKLIELENDYLEVGVTADDKQEDLNIAIYENYINLKNTKVDKPLIESTSDSLKIVALDNQGESVFIKSNELGKVKSVNNKIGDVILKTSDLENDSDYTTNATLTVHTSNKSNPHNVTKSQIGLGNVDNTSDLNKPISTATQNTLDKKIDKPTTNNTNQFVILGDGSTAPKSDFGKVDKVMGVAPDANKNVDISGVAMNWTNASQKMSALVSKHNDATYNRLLGMDANGNLNEVGLPAMTNEMSKATDAQKDAWRVASRKSGETYSIGQPRVDSIAPFILLNDSEMHSLTLIGENLFINNVDLVSRVDIIDSRTNVIVETCESIAVHQTLPSRLSIDITKNLYDINVPYYTKVTHNGIQSIINTNAYFIIKETYFQTTDTLNWRLITPDGQDNSGITFSSNNPNNFSVTKTRDEKLNIVSDYEFDYNKNYYLNLNISTHFPNGEQFVTYFNHTYLTVIDSDRVKGLYQDYSNNIILYGGVAGYREQARVFNPTVGVGNNKTHNVELYINKGICRIVNVTEGINAVIILPISLSGKYKLFLYSTIIGTQSYAAKTSTISVDVNSFSIQ